MYGCTALRPDTSELCQNHFITFALKAPGRATGSARASLRDCRGSAQPRVLRGGCGGNPRSGTPSAPTSLEACPETQFFHCPAVSSPYGKPWGGREGAAGRAPASGRAAAAAPVSCRRNARRYAPVSRSGSPSLLEHSSAYITRWQQSTFPEVS